MGRICPLVGEIGAFLPAIFVAPRPFFCDVSSFDAGKTASKNAGSFPIVIWRALVYARSKNVS
jgi:hypothetical protein